MRADAGAPEGADDTVAQHSLSTQESRCALRLCSAGEQHVSSARVTELVSRAGEAGLQDWVWGLPHMRKRAPWWVLGAPMCCSPREVLLSSVGSQEAF